MGTPSIDFSAARRALAMLLQGALAFRDEAKAQVVATGAGTFVDDAVSLLSAMEADLGD